MSELIFTFLGQNTKEVYKHMQVLCKQIWKGYGGDWKASGPFFFPFPWLLSPTSEGGKAVKCVWASQDQTFDI